MIRVVSSFSNDNEKAFFNRGEEHTATTIIIK